MSVESGLAGGRPLIVRPAAGARARDHRFFTLMAVALALVVFIGFAPTYYLRSWMGGGRELAGLVHLHGVLSTGWMLLFVAQTSLVSAGRTDLHRRLGLLAAALVPTLGVVGVITAITAARHGVTPPGGPPPLAFLAVPLGTIAAFVVLASLGLWYRRRSDTHKRLMLLATIAMLPPALARMRWFGSGGPPLAISGSCAFVLVCLAYDRWSHRRIHPAFLWGGILLMLSLPLRFGLTRSSAWLSVAEWLTR